MTSTEQEINDEDFTFRERVELIEDCPLDMRQKYLLLLLNRLIGKNEDCWPGTKMLVSKCNTSDRNLRRILGELKALSVINVAQRRHQPALISIHWEAVLNRTDLSSLNRSKTGQIRPQDRTDPSIKTGQIRPSDNIDRNKRKKQRRNKSTESFDPLNVKLPEGLDNSQFREAWTEWCEYRKEKRKPISATAFRKQIKKLDSVGCQEAISAINRSIENDWIGLFPEQGGKNAKQNQRTNAGQVFDPRTRGEEIVA